MFNFICIMNIEMVDIRISFDVFDYGDGNVFDGLLGVLVYVFVFMDGRFYFDMEEYWIIDVKIVIFSGLFDLLFVVIYEIGYILGLEYFNF